MTAAEHGGPAPTCDYWHPYGDTAGFCGTPAVVEYRERLHPAGVLYRCARHDGSMYTSFLSSRPERFIRTVIDLNLPREAT